MNTEITKRVDLNLGYSCNADCPFCYYRISSKRKGNGKDLTTKQAKKLLGYIRRKGKDIVDFTGGEPTIRQDIFELIAYAKQIGFKEVTVITNGIRMSNKTFTQKLIDAGVDDFLFSLHGHNAETHDKLTGISGSFEKLKQAVLNASDSGKIRIRSNTVVNGFNYKYVSNIAETLCSYGVQHANFICFNPIVEATQVDEEINVSHSKVSPYLREMVDSYKDKFKRVTIRYLPFCFMPDYEKYITECPQIQYDPFEWDYFIRMRIRDGILLSSIATVIGLLLLPNIKRVLTLPIHTLLRESMMRGLSFKNKAKGKVCKTCKFGHICDGLWKEYIKQLGLSELRTILGKKIEDPAHFMYE